MQVCDGLESLPGRMLNRGLWFVVFKGHLDVVGKKSVEQGFVI